MYFKGKTYFLHINQRETQKFFSEPSIFSVSPLVHSTHHFAKISIYVFSSLKFKISSLFRRIASQNSIGCILSLLLTHFTHNPLNHHLSSFSLKFSKPIGSKSNRSYRILQVRKSLKSSYSFPVISQSVERNHSK